MTQYIYLANRVLDKNGIADSSSIFFYLSGTTTLIDIYSDPDYTIQLPNPLRMVMGAAIPPVYWQEGSVRVVVIDSSGEIVTDDDPYSPFGVETLSADLASPIPGKGRDLIGEPTVSQLLASTAPASGAGAIWHAGGYEYEEVALGGMLQTAGGVHLNVLPKDGAYYFSAFGAVGGEFCDDALDSCWANLPAGATLHMDQSDNRLPYILDRTRPPRTLPLNVIGQPGNLFKLADQSTAFHSPAVLDRDLFGFATSDVLVEGLYIDLNKPNNWYMNGAVKTYSVSNRRVNGITAHGSEVASGAPFTNIKFRRNTVRNPNWVSIGLGGPLSNVDDAYTYNSAFGIDGFEIVENEVREGGQSIINMTGGVRNGVVSRNIGIDCYYDWIRAYRQVLNVDISYNKLTINPGTWDSMVWMTEGTKSHRLGIRIGHNASATGSCADIRVRFNTQVVLDPGVPTRTDASSTDQSLINVSADCVNIEISDNYDKPGNLAHGHNYEGPGAGFRSMRNVVDCDDTAPVGIRYITSSAGAALHDNVVNRPKSACFDFTGCSNVEVLRSTATKGTAATLVYRLSSTAVGCTFTGTRLKGGYTWADLVETADVAANTFNEALEMTFRPIAAASLVIPIDPSFSQLDIDLIGVYASTAGTLNLQLLDASDTPLADIYYRREVRDAAADAVTITRGSAQAAAPIASLGATSSVPAQGCITVYSRGRAMGEGRVTTRTSGGLTQSDVTLTLNVTGATKVALVPSVGALTGTVRTIQSVMAQ